jgi:hypothetical protein
VQGESRRVKLQGLSGYSPVGLYDTRYTRESGIGNRQGTLTLIPNREICICAPTTPYSCSWKRSPPACMGLAMINYEVKMPYEVAHSQYKQDYSSSMCDLHIRKRSDSLLLKILPTIDAWTISISPLTKAKIAISNSTAFPKVALSSPPHESPNLSASSSVLFHTPYQCQEHHQSIRSAPRIGLTRRINHLQAVRYIIAKSQRPLLGIDA